MSTENEDALARLVDKQGKRLQEALKQKRDLVEAASEVMVWADNGIVADNSQRVNSMSHLRAAIARASK